MADIPELTGEDLANSSIEETKFQTITTDFDDSQAIPDAQSLITTDNTDTDDDSVGNMVVDETPLAPQQVSAEEEKRIAANQAAINLILAEGGN